MPPTPSSTHERLRDTIAKRMRMSRIDQALMLMELLGRRSQAPAQDVVRRIRRAWWARFTFNGITRCEKGTYALVGGDEQSDAEAPTGAATARRSAARSKSGHGADGLALHQPEWNAVVELDHSIQGC